MPGRPPVELTAAARLWLRVLVALCALFVVQGVSWCVFGSFDPFGIWDTMAARTLFGQGELPPEAARFGRLLVVPLGATSAGFFALAALVLWRGVGREGRAWIVDAFAVGFAVWFLVDSLFCAAIGAWFNVLWVNLPALVLVAIPTALLRRALGQVLASEDAVST
ncbi:MAG: hypothetical protein DWQ36_24640 [Acidobacteria bacterium]|nr:MAG: hypothetical protein DWQ30_16950 [Acidobacteriota bacterium]REJ99647.1 MAG: hypothetical protein DWQ36_24640 [Acidobacteriota bacterium]